MPDLCAQRAQFTNQIRAHPERSAISQNEIYSRVDNQKPYVGMTSFKGDYVTIEDVKIAKNYLSKVEIQRLNLLVSQFLDYAELQALEQRSMRMNDWIEEIVHGE